MNASPTLSLVICTYRRPEQVRQLLEALEGQVRLPDEILIVDASPDDETRRVADGASKGSLSGRLRYHRPPPEGRGLTRQRNYGIAETSGEIVAFLDDDTIPEDDYFARVMDCFSAHPEAMGVGGYITNATTWRSVDGAKQSALSVYRLGSWERREDFRWRLRRLLGLDALSPPGWMPRSGHARSVSFLPPDGDDHRVEFVMGGASSWRRSVFERLQFSRYFEGYGLYEDLDFCVHAASVGSIYLCTRARLSHHHAPSGRPNRFRYGVMVVRNGWFVWRRRWPGLPVSERVRWWSITILLAACRLAEIIRGGARLESLTEAAGRGWGMVSLMWSLPTDPEGAASSEEIPADAVVS